MLLSRHAVAQKAAPPCCQHTASGVHKQPSAAAHQNHRSGAAHTQRHRTGQSCVPRAVAEAQEVEVQLPETPSAIEVQVNKEDLGDNVVRLHITVPQRCVSELWDNAVAAKESKKKSLVPPKKQTRKGRVLGKDEIKAALVERLGDLAMRQAWQVSGLEERVMEDSITFGEAQDLDPTSDFNFSCEGQIMPELKWLQPYRDLEFQVIMSQDEDVPQLVETQLQARLRESGALQVVTDRGFRHGDVAVVDFAASVAGASIPGLTRPKMRIDSNEPEQLPGLLAGIAGMQAGEERLLQLDVPASPQQQAEGSGEQMACQVTMKELLWRDTPELTDDWVRTTFPELAGVEDLRSQLMQGAQIYAIETADRLNEASVAQAVSAAVEVDVAEELVIDNCRRQFGDQLARLAQQVPPEQMKQIATEEAFAAYVQQKRPEIEESLRAVFGLNDIFTRENLQLDPEELERAVKESVAQGMEDSEDLREQMAQALSDRVAIAWMLENCENVHPVTLPPPSAMQQQ